jgi:hypothetical protein
MQNMSDTVTQSTKHDNKDNANERRKRPEQQLYRPKRRDENTTTTTEAKAKPPPSVVHTANHENVTDRNSMYAQTNL